MDWDDIVILELLSNQEQSSNDWSKNNHSRYQKKYLKTLSIVERRLRNRSIPRAALHNPVNSAWRQLY